MEIFNFFRKFVSNLQNKHSGISVNNSKFQMKPSATSLLAAGATQPLAADRFSPLSHAVTRCHLRGDLVWELSKPDASFSSINRSTTAVVFLSSRLFVAGDLAALTKFILAESSRANCVCQQLRLALSLLPGLLASPLAVQRQPTASSSSEPAEAPPPPTSPWPRRSSPSPPSPSTSSCSW